VPSGVVLRGDNAADEDGVVAAEAILGVVTAVHRRGRSVRCGLGPERRLVAAVSRTGAIHIANRLYGRLRSVLGRLKPGPAAWGLLRRLRDRSTRRGW
jgi:hypothetical protein